jgi:hypothetical protein
MYTHICVCLFIDVFIYLGTYFDICKGKETLKKADLNVLHM